MRLGLLGDIHGNAAALAAVMRAVKQSNVDALCLTGDFIGYYYQPDKVCEMLAACQSFAVRGNHEDMFLECRTDVSAAERYRRGYGSGMDYAMRLLSPTTIDWIGGLPRTRRLTFGDKTLLLAHGSPWDTDCYLYPDSEPALWNRVAQTEADYVVLGHTHHRLTKRLNQMLVINPGSVGQPRDRRPGAAWAILDTVTGAVEHRTEPYDIDQLVSQARSTDPHLPYLWEVLTRQ